MVQYAVDAITDRTARVTILKSRSTSRYFASLRDLLPFTLAQKNGATLEDRLNASLKTETLSGDNA